MMRVFMVMLCSLMAVCSVSARISRREGMDGQAAIYRLPLFERAVCCTKYFEGWHSEKHHPYVGWGHKILPDERYSARTMTKRQAEYVAEADGYIGATVTPHHLLFNRNSLFVGGIRPHYYCLPILKREENRQALLKAVTHKNSRFFAGTDSAPHAKGAKENTCGCAGCYTASHAIELYVQAFEEVGELDKLEWFTSINGPKFYNLPVNRNKVTLVKEEWKIPDELPFGHDKVVPLMAGESMRWKLKR